MLLVPGPTEVSPRVLQTFRNPKLVHNDREAIELLDLTRSNLSKIFQTTNEVLVVPSSGRGGMESALTSIVEPGDDVLVIVNGLFGGWLEEIVARVGAHVTRLDFDWGTHVGLEEISELTSKRQFKVVTMVHGETSTGVANRIDEVGKLVKDTEAVFIVDAVSTLGGMNLPTDDWNVDLCVTASQKCLGSVYGLTAISVSEKAWAKMAKRTSPCPSYTLDLYRWKELWVSKPYPKAYPVVVPPILSTALHEATEEILEEGLEKRFLRHSTTAEFLRKGLERLGIELFAQRQFASDTTTVFNVSDGLTDFKILEHLKNHSMTIAPGMGKLRGKVLRVGHMANVARVEYMTPLLTALEELPR